MQISEDKAVWNTRIAPSPTGDMHIGTARTAYFNWLAARATGGKFVLRIDDTDKARNKPEYVDHVLETMAWLGLDYDNLVYQSNNFESYLKVALDLVNKELAIHENGAIRLNIANDYKWDLGKPTEWFDKVGNGTSVSITDKDYEEFSRMVLIKADGSPTYNFATSQDDTLPIPSTNFRINFVIRGVDHITNTAKQVLLTKLQSGSESPQFAHVGLITVGNKPMSKRDGAASMLYYREKGYDPDAMLNFLARMGWGPSVDDKTTSLLPREKMLELFLTGGKMRSGSSNFDLAKLESFDRKYKARQGVWRNGDRLS